jgi:hypothetical protein
MAQGFGPSFQQLLVGDNKNALLGLTFECGKDSVSFITIVVS